MRRWPVTILALAGLGPTPSPARAATPSAFDLAAGPAVRIAVRAEGWTRVSQPALVAAGLDPGVDPARLHLYTDGIEQAIQLDDNGDAVFDSDEALEFYGVGRDTPWTDTRTYWLTVGDAGGKRVPYVAHPGSGPLPGSFVFTAAMRARRTYYGPLKNGEGSNFFAAFIDGNGVSETLRLPHVAATGGAVLRVVLQGVSVGTHVVDVSLGGQPVGACRFEGQVPFTCTLAPAAITEGDNTVGLVGAGVAPDYSLLVAVEIDYAHAFVADDDRLTFTAPPSTRFTVGGFSSPDVRVFDVTGADPVELVTGMSFDGSLYAATVNTPGATSARTLLAVTPAKVAAPASVTAHRPSSWFQPLAGELVVLSPAVFMDAVRPLVARRVQEGWSVQLVDLQDVYDEFGGGDKSAHAVRDFLAHARDRWRVPPRFVLLVGDASVDPRNFLGKGSFDFAPTKLVDTATLETASDDWFVDRDGDGVPELAIGRLPVRTTAEAAVVVGKLLRYDGGAADRARGGLFVADLDADGLTFQAASQMGAAAVADLLPVETLLIDPARPSPSTLLAKLAAGPFLVDYVGHGSVTVWDGVFSGDDARALGNTELSIYVAMNCLNGLFHDVFTESLAESLLKAPNGGAVAVWASSALNAFEPQVTLNRELLAQLTRTSLGEAAIAAKRAITDSDARRTWILFGDPTLFGMPGPIAPADGGAPDPDASVDGGSGDALDAASADAQDAGQGGPDAMTLDGGVPVLDASQPGDGAADAVSGPGPGSGCDCDVVAGGPGSELAGLLGLAGLVAARRRRRTLSRPGSS